MNALLQQSPYDTDDGQNIGRDPRTISADEWAESGLRLAIGFKAIRAKCLDCCGDSATEVRKCTATGCPLWPLRMGSMPKGIRALRKGADDDTEIPEEAA